jgi:hypothetical protein
MTARAGWVRRAGARVARFAMASVAVGALGGASGCSNQITTPPASTFNAGVLLGEGSVDKIDLLLVVDNSASMADKQAILALALPDLVKGLVNPRCLDDTTQLPVATQPASPTDACPVGSTREFPPVFDIHLGVTSSSLGTFGASGCPDDPGFCGVGATNDDHGHLVTRSDPCGMAAPVATYQDLGFLAWDPKAALTPPGETAVGDPTATPPIPGLTTSLHDLVVGDGQLGCGFESQNEAWYRFLVDPTPYQTIALVDNVVQTSGVDMTLLQQRADFLRPGSLLAIVNVTDETDTSIKESGSFPLFAQLGLHLPLPRSECAEKGPTDPCCASCGQATPAGCPMDPQCQGGTATYTSTNENVALRAFGLISHKARYGIEFFYPPSRYVDALTSAVVNDVNGKAVPNPIYSALTAAEAGAAIRDPSLVFYAAIVGVPWQLIARQDANGTPDLANGINPLAPTDPTQKGGFKSSAELSLTDSKGNTFWDDIAGDPESYVPAKSPFMVESTTPRSGTDPITGAAISPITTPNGGGPMVGGSLLNDHERSIAVPADDIEYACVFPILAPIDCSVPGMICDCTLPIGSLPTTDNPLCEPNPNDSGHLTMQTKAKAYPGIKHLAIVKGLGEQGIAASICAKQVSDPTAADFGYRPAVRAILDRIKVPLRPACPTVNATPGTTGQLACYVVEASTVPAALATSCNACTTPGRQPVAGSDEEAALQSIRETPLAQDLAPNCFCVIPQTTGPTGGNPGQEDCQTSLTPTANGWCYVNPKVALAADVAAEQVLLQKCPTGEQSEIRFVGTGAPAAEASVFVACANF